MEISRKRYKEIKRRLARIVKYCGTRDPFEIAKKMDISCTILPLEGLLGASDISKASICLSKHLDNYARKIICAHELGHIILHREESLNLFRNDRNETDIIEYEANLFAMELLPQIKTKRYLELSKEELQRYIEKKIVMNMYTLKLNGRI